jgi:LacI family transcriptional regulator
VARLAGVSRQTVSNVLNAPERVRAETRDRVRAAIVELGYRTDSVARNLRTRSTRVLGYQVSQSGNPAGTGLLDVFLHALADSAMGHGYNVLIFTADRADRPVDVYEEGYRSRRVDGYVLSDTTDDDDRTAFLAAHGIPFVAFGRTEQRLPYTWVDVDGRSGMRAAVERLIGLGHRRIGYVGTDDRRQFARFRRKGYQDALAAAGLAPDPALEVRGANDVRSGGLAFWRLSALPDPPTAVVAESDYLAAGVLHAAHAAGTAIGPRDFAVIGFDDTPLASLLEPGLTSVRQPLTEAAAHAVRLVLARITGAEPEPVLLPASLAIRGSG